MDIAPQRFVGASALCSHTIHFRFTHCKCNPTQCDSHCQVYKATWKGGMAVAIKVVDINASEASVAGFVREIDVLRACKSPYIVQFLGANWTPKKIVIVTELMARGSLEAALRRDAVSWYKRCDSVQSSDTSREHVVVHKAVRISWGGRLYWLVAGCAERLLTHVT